MRVLLVTVGSRGDVQPLVALASRLRTLGHEVRMCVPPDFQDWLRGMGIPATPIGPPMRRVLSTTTPAPFSVEQLRPMAEAQVAGQFDRIPAAADGCDVVLSATPVLTAAHSVAEMLGIGYVFAVWSPNQLPSPHHAPPPVPLPDGTPTGGSNAERWARDAAHLNDVFRPALDRHRASVGLAPLADVRSHIMTDHPWLAADPTLAPWPAPGTPDVFQSGAWILPDDRPLAPELERFLDDGDPPVYFGFGSMVQVQEDLGHVAVRAARALGRRAVVSRGWAGLTLPDNAPDCVAVDEVNLQRLFPRVSAVVHPGSAGTTTLTALAGAAHVVVPQMYDQHYWAGRVEQLDVGTAHAPGEVGAASLTDALDRALRPDVTARARSLATSVRRDGADLAARRLTGGDGTLTGPPGDGGTQPAFR
ncbi:glycosyltransferase [Micromonospora echinospora]|uniref:glycosyltransferase n=1 Tax=Micromonospora echinospora TaxID=1877 RepID=UPI003CEEEA69